MALEITPAQDFPSGPDTPPPISESELSLLKELRELSDSELGPRFDRALREGEEIECLYQAMNDAIFSNREALVKELLKCKMPVSSSCVQTAVDVKAKDILTIFFDNGWDINTPMGTMKPPILA